MKRLLSKILSAFLIFILTLTQIAYADDSTDINPNIYNIPDREKISFSDDTKYSYGLIDLVIDGIEYAPGANYFSPEITIHTHSRLGIISSSEHHSLSHGQCKNFPLIAKRICARNTIPGTHDNNNFPDGYTGLMKAKNATVKPQYVKLCAFYDPFGGSGVTDLEAYKAYKDGYIDIIDSNMNHQMYHEGDKANPSTGSMETISDGAFNLAMLTAAPFAISALSVSGAATGGLVFIIIGLLKALQEILKPFFHWLATQPFNRIVKETIGCYPIPYSPSPPPFCPIMVVPHKLPELFKICSAVSYPPLVQVPIDDGNTCEQAVKGVDSSGNKKLLYNTFESPVARVGFKERIYACSKNITNSNSVSAKQITNAMQDTDYCLSALGNTTQDSYNDYKKLFDSTALIFGCQASAHGNICLDKVQICTAAAADGVSCAQYIDGDFHQQQSGFRPLYEISYKKNSDDGGTFSPSGAYSPWFDTKIGTDNVPQPDPGSKLDFVGVEIGSYADLQSHVEGSKVRESDTKKLIQDTSAINVYSKLDGGANSDGSNTDSSHICAYGKTDGDDKYMQLGCLPRPQMPLPIVLGRIGSDGCRVSQTVNTIFGKKTVEMQGVAMIAQDRICNSTHRDPLLQVSLGFDDDMQSDILGTKMSGSSKNSTVLHGVTFRTFILDSNFNKVNPGDVGSEVQFDSNGNYIRGGSKLCVGGYVPPVQQVVLVRNNANPRSSNYNTRNNVSAGASDANIMVASTNPEDRILPPYSVSETMPIVAYGQILNANLKDKSTDTVMVQLGSNEPISIRHDGNVINNVVDSTVETVRALTPYEYGLCVDIPAPSCASETKSGLLWPTSKIGAVVKLQCLNGSGKSLTRKCNWRSATQDDGKWGDPTGTCGSNTCPAVESYDGEVYIAETDQEASAGAFCKYNARVTTPRTKCKPDSNQPKWDVESPTNGVDCKCLFKQACACAPALYPTSLFQMDGSGNMVEWANIGARSSDWCDMYNQNKDIFDSIATNTPDDQMTYGYIDQVQDRSVVDIYIKRDGAYHLVAQNVQDFPATKILVYYRSQNSILYYFTPSVTIVDSSNKTFSQDYTGYIPTTDYRAQSGSDDGVNYYYKLSTASISNLTTLPYGYTMDAAALSNPNPDNSDYAQIDAAVGGLSVGDYTQKVRLFGQSIYITKITSAAR